MKKAHQFLILALAGAGLLSGFAARRMSSETAVTISEPSLAGTKSPTEAKTSPVAISPPDKAVLPPLPPSTDTVEILLALDDATLYPRLAAWLLGAGEQDIAAYWNGYQSAPNRKTWIADLVFINWTRLDPAGAIAAVAGTKDDYFPWWAWTAHDPQAALAAAIATAPKMVGRVARGIGGFHPEWLRENLDQIPEWSRSSAFSSFRELDDTEQPLESLKFMQENAMGFDPGIFRNLVRKDPWEAFAWLEQNPSLQAQRYSSTGNPLDVLLETMIRDHPDDLERLVARTPPGEMKRKMEAAVFQNLISTDPAAAITQAKATESTAIAAERFAKIGLSLVKTDPDQAFEMAKTLLEMTPGGRSASVRVEYPRGSSSWGGRDNGTSELLAALVARDPERLMQTAVETGKENPRGSGFANVAHHWANQDLVSYTTWVNQQADPVIREDAVGPVVTALAELGQYPEAIEWARSAGNSGASRISHVFYQWGRADPTGAGHWLENSDLPDEQKAQLQKNIQQASRSNDE